MPLLLVTVTGAGTLLIDCEFVWLRLVKRVIRGFHCVKPRSVSLSVKTASSSRRIKPRHRPDPSSSMVWLSGGRSEI